MFLEKVLYTMHKEEYNGLTLYFLDWSEVFDDKVIAIRTFMTRALKHKRMKYHKLGR